MTNFGELFYKGKKVTERLNVPYGEVWFVNDEFITSKRKMTKKEFKKYNKPPWGDLDE